MKKLQIIAIAAIILGTSISNANAQLLRAALPATETAPAAAEKTAEAAKFSKASILVNKAGYKAVKGFTNRHKDGDDVKWVAETEVISASFNRDDARTVVVFDKRGNWMRDMKTYSEDKMPKDIRRLIKTGEYYDYKINLVQEIKEGELLFYVVHLEDATTIKQVIVCDGEARLYSGFTKQQ